MPEKIAGMTASIQSARSAKGDIWSGGLATGRAYTRTNCPLVEKAAPETGSGASPPRQAAGDTGIHLRKTRSRSALCTGLRR